MKSFFKVILAILILIAVWFGAGIILELLTTLFGKMVGAITELIINI